MRLSLDLNNVSIPPIARFRTYTKPFHEEKISGNAMSFDALHQDMAKMQKQILELQNQVATLNKQIKSATRLNQPDDIQTERLLIRPPQLGDGSIVNSAGVASLTSLSVHLPTTS